MLGIAFVCFIVFKHLANKDFKTGKFLKTTETQPKRKCARQQRNGNWNKNAQRKSHC